MTAVLVAASGLGALVCLGRGRAAARATGSRGAVAGSARRVLSDPEVRRRTAAVAAAVGLGGAFAGVAGAVVSVAVCVAALGPVTAALARRRARRADDEVPHLVEHVARALRAGHDLPRALGVAAAAVGGAHGPALERVVARVEAGAELAAALDEWVRGADRPAVRLAAGAIGVSARVGGARAGALDGVAATLRGRAAVLREVRALSSQSAASATVMVALPIVVGALGGLADPRLARVLFASPAGWACVLGAVALDGVGALWMARVVRSV